MLSVRCTTPSINPVVMCVAGHAMTWTFCCPPCHPAPVQATGAPPPEVENRMGSTQQGAPWGGGAGSGEVEEELPYLGEEVDA